MKRDSSVSQFDDKTATLEFLPVRFRFVQVLSYCSTHDTTDKIMKTVVILARDAPHQMLTKRFQNSLPLKNVIDMVNVPTSLYMRSREAD